MEESPVIYAYTRAQAIADGYLVDVSATAAEAGIRFPVAVTRALWDRHIAVPARLQDCQDEAGRLWDVLWLFRLAARRGGSDVTFRVLFLERPGRRPVPRQVRAVCGPGDHAEPVVTLMLPDED